MDTRAALLRAIVEEPDDDTHRLVFADCLDDEGQHDWAALIRAQCALHPLLLDEDPYVSAALLPVDQLAEHARRQVLTTLDGLFGLDVKLGQPPWSDWFRWRVQRGMIGGVELWGPGLERFVEFAGHIFERLPLSAIILRTYQRPNNHYANIARESFAALLQIPQMARLHHLDIRAHAVSYQLPALTEFGKKFTGGRVWVQGYPITSHEPAAWRAREALGKHLVVRDSHADNPSDEIPF